MSKTGTGVRVATAAAAGALLLTACGGGSSSVSGGSSDGNAQKGGTLNFITISEKIQHLDPQRNYTGEDMAFANGYLQRTLTAYKLDKDDNAAGGLVGDLATDAGTAADGGKSWSFTLRDGVKWEDGKPVTCDDVKYGVSRTFAQEIITDGPTYAISMLDVAADAEGNSLFKGPYKADAAGQAAFDKAVMCEGNKITFHLKRPAADFNYTVTLPAFSAVPKAADTGEKYDDKPMSNGPYKIQTYTPNKELVLVRNDQWDAATDSYRGAYPDQIKVTFGLDADVIDQRLIADSGADQTALGMADPVQPQSLASVFNDPRFESRRFDGYDPYVRYWAINTKKVPELKHRQAILAAVNREELRKIAGGSFAGDLADGVVKPNLSLDYQPTGLWDTLLGQKIPDTGDAEYAKKLIAESGKPMPELVFDYAKTPVADKGIASIIASLGKAGIKVKPNAIEPGSYYGIVLDPEKQGHVSSAGWGPDWLNASTVVPELFTPSGGFPLSQYDDAAFNKKVDDAKLIADRNEQGKAWAELNKEASGLALTIPTRFAKQQRLVGSKIGGAYLWAPFGSWPYASLYVKK